jgi:hypothetical protein
MSRRLIGDRPMTPAERKRRSRALRARPTPPLDAKLAWDANLKAFENEALRPFAQAAQETSTRYAVSEGGVARS